ncbi:uncharacterized protein LOC135923358 isoform X2 [Gordionus sp. m RMFG-2023]|uniref:uncharacterized protein LOC135923358 isoform X2 n=1 Tax=Gordionus sp. m RMFG-2023 TaxID=3053472 RepID=UPI0031FCD837
MAAYIGEIRIGKDYQASLPLYLGEYPGGVLNNIDADLEIENDNSFPNHLITESLPSSKSPVLALKTNFDASSFDIDYHHHKIDQSSNSITPLDECAVKADCDAMQYPENDHLIYSSFEHQADMVWNPNSISDDSLLVFIRAARSITAFAGMCHKNGDNKEDGASVVSRDDTTQHYFDLLHENKYDVTQTLEVLGKEPLPKMWEKDWSHEEAKCFTRAIKIIGKEFHRVRDEYLKHKKTKDLIQFYYFWKKSPYNPSRNQRRNRKSRRTINNSILNNNSCKSVGLNGASRIRNLNMPINEVSSLIISNRLNDHTIGTHLSANEQNDPSSSFILNAQSCSPIAQSPREPKTANKDSYDSHDQSHIFDNDDIPLVNLVKVARGITIPNNHTVNINTSPSHDINNSSSTNNVVKLVIHDENNSGNVVTYSKSEPFGIAIENLLNSNQIDKNIIDEDQIAIHDLNKLTLIDDQTLELKTDKSVEEELDLDNNIGCIEMKEIEDEKKTADTIEGVTILMNDQDNVFASQPTLNNPTCQNITSNATNLPIDYLPLPSHIDYLPLPNINSIPQDDNEDDKSDIINTYQYLPSDNSVISYASSSQLTYKKDDKTPSETTEKVPNGLTIVEENEDTDEQPYITSKTYTNGRFCRVIEKKSNGESCARCDLVFLLNSQNFEKIALQNQKARISHRASNSTLNIHDQNSVEQKCLSQINRNNVSLCPCSACNFSDPVNHNYNPLNSPAPSQLYAPHLPSRTSLFDSSRGVSNNLINMPPLNRAPNSCRATPLMDNTILNNSLGNMPFEASFANHPMFMTPFVAAMLAMARAHHLPPLPFQTPNHTSSSNGLSSKSNFQQDENNRSEPGFDPLLDLQSPFIDPRCYFLPPPNLDPNNMAHWSPHPYFDYNMDGYLPHPYLPQPHLPNDMFPNINTRPADEKKHIRAQNRTTPEFPSFVIRSESVIKPSTLPAKGITPNTNQKRKLESYTGSTISFPHNVPFLHHEEKGCVKSAHNKAIILSKTDKPFNSLSIHDQPISLSNRYLSSSQQHTINPSHKITPNPVLPISLTQSSASLAPKPHRKSNHPPLNPSSYIGSQNSHLSNNAPNGQIGGLDFPMLDNYMLPPNFHQGQLLSHPFYDPYAMYHQFQPPQSSMRHLNDMISMPPPIDYYFHHTGPPIQSYKP